MNSTEEDIWKILRPIGELFKREQYADGLAQLEIEWRKIPEPKHETKNSYLIVSYGVTFSQKINDLDKAWIWATRGLLYTGNFNLGGESELQVGDIAYLRGDIELAKTYFKMTYANSKSRLFKEKDPKYLELAKAK
jgi:hypothetical protein